MRPMQPLNQPEHRLRRPVIQIPRRLVRQQNLRLRHQSPRQANPLLLPAAQLTRPVRSPIRQPHLAQPEPRLLQRRRPPHSPRQQRHRHILQSRKLRQQIMKLPNIPHIPIPVLRGLPRRKRTQPVFPAPNLTRRRSIQRRQQMQQSTFSRPTLPHNRDHLPRMHLQIQPSKQLQRPTPRATLLRDRRIDLRQPHRPHNHVRSRNPGNGSSES